jgi:hypothetical protein
MLAPISEPTHKAFIDIGSLGLESLVADSEMVASRPIRTGQLRHTFAIGEADCDRGLRDDLPRTVDQSKVMGQIRLLFEYALAEIRFLVVSSNRWNC